MSLKKTLAIILAVIVFANFFLLVFGLETPIYFWIITIVLAALAYLVVPRIR